MLSPKTIRGLHGILHKALNQAAAIGYLRFNPADACNIPKVVRKELTPLDTEDIQKFLTEIRGNPFEILLSVTLFGRLREGEVLALSWHNIDFEYGMVLICQLQRFREGMPQFQHCVVCFSHIYAQELPERRIRDYDNLELKQFLDVAASFILTDDNGLLCDAYNTTELGEEDCTRLFLMDSTQFPAWLAERQNGVKSISDF
jgi:hypothetical protein